jgi:hypothetical protein
MLGIILLALLVLLILATLPTWPYRSGWGYYPSGLFVPLLMAVIVLLLAGVFWSLPIVRSCDASCGLG